MADNFDVKDFTLGTAATVKAKEISTVKYPGHILYDEAGAEVVGEVTASPTANTLLARVKDLLSLIVLAAGTNIIGKVGIDQTTDGTTNAVHLTAGTNAIGKVDHNTTGIGHGEKTVTTAGTDVALAGSSTPCKWVWIYAYASNTGKIAIGASGVDASATAGTGTGGALAAGESVILPADDVADIFIDATVNGEGVRYTYGT